MAELLAESVLETRTLAAEVELREVDGETPMLRGYAATFNQPYAVGHFDERIHPKAFDTTLRGKPDVALLVDHEGQPLARTGPGTLRLKPDGTGLGVEADLNPDDPDASKLMAKMRHGDLDKMSFAFRVPPGGDTWDYTADRPQRQLREVSLAGGDVSVVTYPANAGTSVQMRAADDAEASWVLAEGMWREIRAGQTLSDEHMDLLLATMTELGLEPRAPITGADRNDLPDSAFAYIEPGGTKDADGKTVPRSNRHFIIVDKAHVQNALARIAQGAAFSDQAKAAVMAAAKKFGIDVDESNSTIPLDLALRLAEADALRRSA